MQIFELHFNPKLKEDQVFDSFIYEPESVYEKKLGSLYMAGQLQNTFPQNLKFLDRLAGIIKKNYYTLSVKTPEKALSFCLKKTNEYLDQEIKKDNVSWLGNLNFAVLAVIGADLIFTKTGKLKIFLLRGSNIIDIGKELELREIEPYPVRIFLNTASGKLSEGDIILVLTKDIFGFFKQQNLLDKIAKAEEIDSKKIKEIIPSSLFIKGEGAKVSGICFLAQIQKKDKKTRQILPILFQEKRRLKLLPKIHPVKYCLSRLNCLRHYLTGQAVISPLTKLFNRIKLPKINPVKWLRSKFNRVKIPLPKIPKIQFTDNFRKKIILILILIFFLILGFLIF